MSADRNVNADRMLNAADMDMFKCSNVQMFKCSNVQMFKLSNVQMFKCSNVKYQMSNVNKIKLLSVRTSGVPPVIFRCASIS